MHIAQRQPRSRAQCAHLKAGIKQGDRVFDFPSLNSPKISLCSHQNQLASHSLKTNSKKISKGSLVTNTQ